MKNALSVWCLLVFVCCTLHLNIMCTKIYNGKIDKESENTSIKKIKKKK